MTVITIPTIAMTKADEIALLGKLVAAFADRPETYLNDLLTPELLNWFDRAVKDDWNADIANALAATSISRNEATLRAENAEQRAGMWEASFKEADADRTRLQIRVNEELSEKTDALRNAEQARRENADLSDGLDRAEAVIAKYEDRALDDATTIRLQAEQINQLKARLYDAGIAAKTP